MISLNKGQKVSLLKKDDSFSVIKFGANWGAITGNKNKGIFECVANFFFGEDDGDIVQNVDLDLSVLCLDDKNSKVGLVYFGRLNNSNYSINHSGDDRVGDIAKDDVDNETITIKVKDLPANYKKLIFILNSYNGVLFNHIPYMTCRVYDQKQTHVKFDLTNDGSMFRGKKGIVLGSIIKDDAGNWDFTAIGKTYETNSLQSICSDVQSTF